MNMPQLRVRTGFSYKECYGTIKEVIARAQEIGCTTFGMVDWGTWGHVRFEQAMKKAGLVPMFGMEVPILSKGGDAPEDGGKRTRTPRAWMLARDTKAFYRATSRTVRGGLAPNEFARLRGVIRFAGGALADLLAEYDEAEGQPFDYIDVNPASFLAARRAVLASRKTGIPMVITSYNDMPSKSHADLAYSWEVRDSVGMRHIADEDEIWTQLRFVMTRDEFDAAIANTHSVAEELAGVTLAKAPMIHLDGDIDALCAAGKQFRLERGHIAEWTDEYEERLKTELEQIKLKKFESYFLVVSDLIRYAKQNMLVGPARGSSAGSLVCYLLRITEIDPIPHHLLFYRFIDISRSDLPDIDIDFADTKRYMVFDYLREKYGKENVVKLGNINTLKALSVIAQVSRKFDISFRDTDQIKAALIEYSSADERYGKGLEDTIMKTAPGNEFREKHPVAAELMGNLELHPSHSGVHAAGILVCNDQIWDYCTVTEDGIAQLDKPDAEYLNLLKIDALGLRTLGVIDDAGVVTADQLYDLKLDDQSVLDILNEDKMSGIFQFEGQAVRQVSNLVNITKFENIDHITALARPGPLSAGMAWRYIYRVAGTEEVSYKIPQLEKYLWNTYGVFLYQEQIMSVVKDIGNFDWEKTSAIRKAMSGRKGEEYFNKMGTDFVQGAVSNGVAADKALEVWKEMVTFGAWGFNKSHSVSYAVVTYWTCYLKRYFPLQFAAACLRSAKSDVQTIAILREITREGIQYSAMDPMLSGTNWEVREGRLLGGIQNAKGYGAIKAASYIAKREAGLLTQADIDRLSKAEVQFSDLNEAHTRWAHLYGQPEIVKVYDERIRSLKSVKERQEAVFIGKIVKKVLSDENEPIRVQKRGGKMFDTSKTGGETRFIDVFVVDDSVDAPYRLRIRPGLFRSIGLDIAENAPKGAWYLWRGWRLEGLEMFLIKKCKRLDGTPLDPKSPDFDEKYRQIADDYLRASRKVEPTPERADIDAEERARLQQQWAMAAAQQTEEE